jgi:hypothetical protein
MAEMVTLTLRKDMVERILKLVNKKREAAEWVINNKKLRETRMQDLVSQIEHDKEIEREIEKVMKK